MLTSSAMLTSSSTTRTWSGDPSRRVRAGAWLVSGMLTASCENLSVTLREACDVPVKSAAQVPDARPRRAPPLRRAAAHVDRGVLALLVRDPVAVVDRRHSPAAPQQRRRALLGDSDDGRVALRWWTPLPEAVVTAVRLGQTVRGAVAGDRTGFAVVGGEDRGAGSLRCRQPRTWRCPARGSAGVLVARGRPLRQRSGRGRCRRCSSPGRP